MPKGKSQKSPDLATWIDSRQSQGLYFFHRQEALKTLNVSELAFKKAAARLSKKKRIVRIHGGFFIIIPLEYAATGILPAEWFIADLMDYIGQPFYVGLLSAAALHGAGHQQPQQFHVVTTGPLRDMKMNGLAIRFFLKSKFANVPQIRMKVQTGYIPVSTPEATAFDLIRYSRRIGGLGRVLTVLQELGEVMDPGNLEKAAKADEKRAYTQRLGFLLEKAGFSNLTGALFQWVDVKYPLPVKLEPSMPTRGSKKAERWRILVNIDVESDL
jgi:predicted transcriptional regulator of viral defense system